MFIVVNTYLYIYIGTCLCASWLPTQQSSFAWNLFSKPQTMQSALTSTTLLLFRFKLLIGFQKHKHVKGHHPCEVHTNILLKALLNECLWKYPRFRKAATLGSFVGVETDHYQNRTPRAVCTHFPNSPCPPLTPIHCTCGGTSLLPTLSFATSQNGLAVCVWTAATRGACKHKRTLPRVDTTNTLWFGIHPLSVPQVSINEVTLTGSPH